MKIIVPNNCNGYLKTKFYSLWSLIHVNTVKYFDLLFLFYSIFTYPSLCVCIKKNVLKD